MTTDEKTTTTFTTMESTSAKTHRLLNDRLLQNFHLVWLDENVEEAETHYADSIMKLRQVVHTVNVFNSIDECIDFITDIDERVVMIISGQIIQTIVSIVQDISHVTYIYVLCENDSLYEDRVKDWPKVTGIYKDIVEICQELRQVTKIFDHNCVSLGFLKATEVTTSQNLDTLDCSFMYTQILKDILLTIDFNPRHISEFVMYCRKHIAHDESDQKNLDEIERTYQDMRPIWWYTSNNFLYTTVNRALRLMEMDLIVNMGFFVRDICNDIIVLHNEHSSRHRGPNPSVLYRGQALSLTDFNKIKTTQGGLLAFNNFLSTSRDRAVAKLFAEAAISNSDQVSILFEIHVDPSVSSAQFAEVSNTSQYQTEEEFLFSMHAVFRIGPMKQIEEKPSTWEVQLTLTSDKDPQLQALAEAIYEETEGSTGWFRLGKLMRKVAQYNKAEQVFMTMLAQNTDQRQKANILYELGWIKIDQGQNIEALSFCDQALEIAQRTLPTNDPVLATFHHNIGGAYGNIEQYLKALSCYQQTLTIWKKTLPADHPDLASSYNNIGSVYFKMGEYARALVFYEEALSIKQKTLPANHPDVATAYNNIGNVHCEMNEVSKALSCYQQALKIREKSLPNNHPSLASSYNNFGGVYYKMSDYSKALSFYEQALRIQQKTLPDNHPDLAISYNNLGTVYENIGEYPNAHSSYEQALQIWKNILPENHPDLATCYNNIGDVHSKMEEYSEALSSYQKALQISEKIRSANDLALPTSYDNIGGIYYKMNDYSKALFYYEQALEIRQKNLPNNHPVLAASQSNIGLVYQDMGEYSKALRFYEQALEAWQKGLPVDHPNLATFYNNIGLVYYKVGEYSKALLLHEQALAIRQKSLPSNHADLAASYNHIGTVYFQICDYSKAISFSQQALAIQQKILPVDDCDLGTSYNNLGLLYSKMGNPSKALLFYERALAIQEKSLPPNHPDLASSYEDVATVYYKTRKFTTALTYLERALNIFQCSLPPTHPDVTRTKNSIEIVRQKMNSV